VKTEGKCGRHTGAMRRGEKRGKNERGSGVIEGEAG